MEKYTKLKKMANALYGCVWLARENCTGNLYAIKEIKLQFAEMKQTMKDNKRVHEDVFCEHEVNKFLSKRKSPLKKHIVLLKEEFQANGHLYLVLEYCSKGELFDICTTANSLNEPLPIETVLKYFKQIVGGVKFMHDNGFAHRDISLENVLVDEQDNAKICDFGLVAQTNNYAKQSVGEAYYMAPEVQAGEIYDPVEADLWSLGILLFILLTGVPLVEKASVNDPRYCLIKQKGVRALLEHWGMVDQIPELAMNLLCCLLKPVDRMPLDEVIDHPWLQSDESVVLSIRRKLERDVKTSPSLDVKWKKSEKTPILKKIFGSLSKRLSKKVKNGTPPTLF